MLHTFTVMPPYAPGGLDTWENLWLQRSAAHPWCGMRNMASLIGAGVLDRYPNLHLGVLEAEVHEIVEGAVEFAKTGTDPQPEDALKNVYA